MDNDWQTRFIWGGLIAAITGLYGFFVKHIIGHTSKDNLQRLKDSVQYKDNCEEIVKRFESYHQENKVMQQRILDKLDTLA